MRRFIIITMIIYFSIIPINYAYSEGFLYMIDAIGIEKINVNGLALNEEIYEKYKLIVYGDPVTIGYEKQRWKTTENGMWIHNGVKGEYWILGQDYSGKVIHNELFPDDYNSGTSPINWNYRIVKDAEESWNDTSLYIYEMQREYMLNQKLSRFGVTYDLTALDIGLDKAKVENYATWGNAGSIYTEKPGEGNVYWAATFNVPAMAGEAKLNCILNFPNGTEYTISKNENSIEIPYIYGAQIEGVSDFAKPEHIKIIESSVKIDGQQIGVVSSSECMKIGQNGKLIINKSEYPNINKIILKVENNAFAATYFPNDPIMYDSEYKILTINFQNEYETKTKIKNDENAPVIYNINLSRVTTDSKGNIQTVALYKNKKTKREFICAGQVMKIRVKTSKDASGIQFSFNGLSSISTLDETTKKFLWYEPTERNEYKMFSSLKSLENAYKFPRSLELINENEYYKIFEGIYVIPYETTQTLHSWNSLRNESKNAFEINENRIFTRIMNPYKLVIRANSSKGKSTEVYLLDIAERWDELFNRDISSYISW